MFATLRRLFAGKPARTAPARKVTLRADALEARDTPVFLGSSAGWAMVRMDLPQPGTTVTLNPQPLPPKVFSPLAGRGIIVVGG